MESNQDVFISHSSVDSKLAYAMCDYLEEKGVRCWVAPRDVQGGTEYAEAIIMGIRSCKIMVVLFNKNANDSIYVKNEVERAFNYKSILIPFKLDQTIPSATLELFLGSVHSLDATKGNPEDCFELLYQNCARSLGKKENSIKVKPVLPKTTEKKENSANKENEIKIFGEGNYSSDEIQIWTSKNLDVETYRNGNKIPQVQDKNAWSKLTTGAWCYYENKTANGKKYGKLYNWYAINDPRGLAPKGYHIPKFWEEWSFLNDFDGEKDSGTKMKSTTGWDNDGNGTNANGFNGLPGGYRTADGNFLSIGECGMWWSSTVDGSEGFLRRGTSWAVDLHANLRIDLPNWSGSPIYLRTGCSVRCVKDLDEQ